VVNPPPHEKHRALLLTSLLQQPDEKQTDKGFYDPINNERKIFLGKDRGSALAHMVSWHESHHAFLNSSTCHGNAMIFAGALANAGNDCFVQLVERMIDVSLNTHETYATVSGISAATRGDFDDQILENYPDYQPLLQSFKDIFPSTSRPVLSVMALTSCARAAMQTPIYKTLIEQPCDLWTNIDLDTIGKPDERFRLLMTHSSVERAITAMKNTLHDAGGQYATIANTNISANTERQIWLSADSVLLDRVCKAAFDAFAELLHHKLDATCQFDNQKKGLAKLIRKVEDYAGENLKIQFWTPSSQEDDEVSVFVDFRNEQLVLSDRPLPAMIISFATHQATTVDFFVHDADGQRYVQFIAMPVEKARTLYMPLEGAELLTNPTENIVTGFRRRWAPQGLEPRVELLLLEPDEAPAVLKSLASDEVDIYVVYALSLLQTTNWVLKWLLAEGSVDRMLVLIDDDPIELITRHGDRGADLHLTYLKAKSNPELDEHTEILCFTAGDELDVIYFTPCSPAFRLGVMEWV
jgi:hypothetical protein